MTDTKHFCEFCCKVKVLSSPFKNPANNQKERDCCEDCKKYMFRRFKDRQIEESNKPKESKKIIKISMKNLINTLTQTERQ